MVEYFDKEERKEVEERLSINNSSSTRLQPWQKYKELKESPVPEPETLVSKIKEISTFNLRLASFIGLLLMTGCRIEELTKYSFNWVHDLRDINGKKIAITNEVYSDMKDIVGEMIRKPSIQLKDIDVRVIDGKEWVIIKSRVEKYHNVKQTHYKTAWLLRSEQKWWFPLLEILDDYLEGDFKDADSETQLYTFSSDYVRQSIQKYLNLTPHILRNYCAKYLVWKEGFTPQDLMNWFGWKTVEMSIEYSKSDENTIRDRILGNI